MNFFPLFCFFLPISVQVFMYDCLCLVTTACMFVKARSWHQMFPLAAYHFIAVESLASLASLTHSLVLVTSCYCLPVVGGPPNWSNLWEDAEDTDSSHHVWVARALWILCTELSPQPPQVLSCSSLYTKFYAFYKHVSWGSNLPSSGGRAWDYGVVSVIKQTGFHFLLIMYCCKP